MIIEVMCRIADGPLRPAELEINQSTAPLVSWSVHTDGASEADDLRGTDLAIELHFPDDIVWTGEVYPVAGVEPDNQVPGQPAGQAPARKMQLRGTGPLREDSMVLHADVVAKRLDAMVARQT